MRALAGSGNLKHGVVIGVLVSRDRHIIFGFHLYIWFSFVRSGIRVFCLAVISAGCRISLTASNNEKFLTRLLKNI